MISAILLGVLALAGAQQLHRGSSELDSWSSWSSEYPEIRSPRISERVFRDSKEYKYLYDGQILTGLPETADQYSGLRIRAIVAVQLRSGVDVLKIAKATLGRLNERSIDGPLEMQPAQSFEELTGAEAAEWNAALTKPIRFQYDDNTGAVSDVVSLESDPFWSVNIKRAILSTFNLKLKSQAAEILSHPRFAGLDRQQQRQQADDNTEYFSVMEEGIGGECEAVYLVQTLPAREVSLASSATRAPVDEVLNVTKSWNYENCKSRPISLESLNSGSKCVGMKDRESSGCSNSEWKKDKIIKSASQTRYRLLGNAGDFLIESAVTEAVHKFSPYSDKAGSITAYINATLRLIYAGEWSPNTIMPTEQGIALRGLRQLLPQDRDIAGWQSLGQATDRSARFVESNSEWPNVAAKKTIIKALLTRLVEDLADSEVEPESANLVLQMSVILGYATSEELAEIHREVKTMASQSVEQDQIENLWFDVLALTGTKPAVLYIKQAIVQGSLWGERAAQTLNTLAFSINKSDQDIVGEILALCKLASVTGQVNKACWLCVGTLAHKSCIEDAETTTLVQNTVVRNGNPKCNSAFRQRVIIDLLARMKNTQDQEYKILMLKAIGNTGFSEAIQDLKAIFEDDAQSTILRTNAIYALIRLAVREPEMVQALVLPVYHDKTNPFQVRIAAFDVAIEAKADLPDLQLIARSLKNEKSKQVGSYVWSKLNTLANATHPCFQELSDNAALALEFGTPFNTGISHSKGIHLDGFSDSLEVGGFAQINTIGDPSSIIPREVNVRLNAHVMGMSHDLIEAGIETTGVSDLIKKFAMSRSKAGNPLAQLFGDYDDEEEEQEEGRSERQSGRSAAERLSARKSFKRPEFDEFDRLLGLSDRQNEEIKASAYLKIFGHEVRFLTLSPKAILTAIGEAYVQPSALASLAQGSLLIDQRKALMAADSELTIPTELGLPLTMELKAPVVVSAKGTLGLKTQPPMVTLASLQKFPQSLTVESDVKISAAMEVHGKMSIWAAYFKIGAGIRAQISSVIPLDGEVTIDLKSGKMETTIDLPQQTLELIKVEVMPLTYTKSIPKTLVPHQPDRQDVRGQQQGSQGAVEYNRQPLENEQPIEYFRFKTALTENPFMLSQSGRPSTQFYAGLAVPILDIKEIASFDALKTKTMNLRLGHPAAGFVLDVAGQWQMAHGVPNVPFLPVGGKNKVIVTLLPAKNGLKSISAALHWRKEQSLAAARPTWDKLFDKLEDYNSAAILERLGSDLPAAFAKDDKSGYSAQVIVKGHTVSSKQVAMQAVLSWVRGMDGKFVKVAAELSSPHAQLPYQVCIHGHSEYPETYDSWNLSPATNQPVTGKWEMAAGSSCRAADATKIKASFSADKSTQQLTHEQNDVYSIRGSVIPEIISKTIEPMAYALKGVWQECDADRKQGARWSPACETVKDLYSQLMQIKIDVDYQNVPRGVKVLLDKAEQMCHAAFLWNSDVDNVDIQNTPSHVTIWANFSGEQDTVDLIYSTPKKDAKLLGLPVPYPLGPIQADDEPLNLWEAMLNEDLDNICSVSGNRINTLDSVKLNIGQSRCWSLMAKDASREELWSVLFAQAGPRSADGKKMIVFIGENKIELEPASSFASARQLRSSGDVVIKINGRTEQLTGDEETIQVAQDIEVTMETDGDATSPYVAISAKEYGLELWFDGHNIALKPTHWLRNQVVGLCGNGNGEEWDDMMLPNGQSAQSPEDLFRGFTVRRDGCDAEQSSELRSPGLSQYPYTRDQAECGKQKTIVKRRQGKVCFSVNPVEVCPAGCSNTDEDDSAEERVQVQRIGFHCLPEDSSRVSALLREVHSRILTELSMKPVNDYFAVPVAKPGCGGLANDSGLQRNMQQRSLRA